MPSIFDQPAGALSSNAAYMPLLQAYAPLEEAFRSSYAAPQPGSIYQPARHSNMPGTPNQSIYGQTGSGLLDYNAGNVGPSSQGTAQTAPSPNDVQSQMAPMGMLSPQSIGLGIASNMLGPAGMVSTIGQMMNMLGPAANLSPEAIAIANNPSAMQGMIAQLDPTGAIAIAPPTNHPLFDVVVAQQHAASQAPSPVSNEVQEGLGTLGIDTGAAAGSAGGDGSGTVICTELWREGWLDDATYEADMIYGARQDQAVIDGYHRWAVPYVRLMQRPGLVGLLALGLALLFALPWARAMKAEVHGGRKPLFGGMLLRLGPPLCRALRPRGRSVAIDV